VLSSPPNGASKSVSLQITKPTAVSTCPIKCEYSLNLVPELSRSKDVFTFTPSANTVALTTIDVTCKFTDNPASSAVITSFAVESVDCTAATGLTLELTDTSGAPLSPGSLISRVTGSSPPDTINVVATPASTYSSCSTTCSHSPTTVAELSEGTNQYTFTPSANTLAQTTITVTCSFDANQTPSAVTTTFAVEVTVDCAAATGLTLELTDTSDAPLSPGSLISRVTGSSPPDTINVVATPASTYSSCSTTCSHSPTTVAELSAGTNQYTFTPSANTLPQTTITVTCSFDANQASSAVTTTFDVKVAD